MGLVALLNLSTLSVLYALLLLFNVLLYWKGCLSMDKDFRWWSWPLAAVLALVVAYVIYRGAVAQARAYGNLIRVAYDEHRFRILDALNIRRPPTPQAEHLLWQKLSRWLYQQDLGAAREMVYSDGGDAGKDGGAS